MRKGVSRLTGNDMDMRWKYLLHLLTNQVCLRVKLLVSTTEIGTQREDVMAQSKTEFARVRIISRKRIDTTVLCASPSNMDVIFKMLETKSVGESVYTN